MLFLASVCAMVFTFAVCKMPRCKWPMIFERLGYEFRYALLGNKDMIKDKLEAKYNKKVTCPQTGRVAIVTGGSRGIGVEVVKMLLELEMHVIVACRNPSAGNATITKIRESGVTKGTAKVYVLDNSSMESVRKFAEAIKKDFEKIDVLINNAGVMFCPYEETVDGFEQQWAVNYLSHFLLTALLLPLLNAAGSPETKSRIVNVSSCAHTLGEINFDDPNCRDRFFTHAAYANSKLAQVVFTRKLQNALTERNYNVEVFSVHPGIVYTEIFVNSYVWRYRTLTYYLFKSPEQGAMSIVHAALSKTLEGRGGAYINNCRESKTHPIAFSSTVQDKLFELSLKQSKLNDFFSPELSS